ncbi:hypothetical protein QA649_36250 [Bradyrhizobium sp. CB1717]|uniref:hypothetical protein n=1 Tax=Bradyrhizobium sp. CB1717 TaxID=3039154 RepID=UPI0024B13EE3|nr:hypothetical protein [Bradyrhizobium sp. CB1717]WFU23434.1 hypothetical protein QA649_36250 [Bradyrhizobium sp. CB1717]
MLEDLFSSGAVSFEEALPRPLQATWLVLGIREKTDAMLRYRPTIDERFHQRQNRYAIALVDCVWIDRNEQVIPKINQSSCSSGVKAMWYLFMRLFWGTPNSPFD